MARSRLVTGFSIAAVLIIAIFIKPLSWILYLLLAVSAFIGTYEYTRIAEKREARPTRPVAYLFIAALLYDAWRFNLAHFLSIVIAAVAVTLVLRIFIRGYIGSVAGSAATIFSGLWMGLSMALGIMILKLDNGRFLIGLLMAVVFLGDSGAWYTGKKWGRTKLAPRLSPNKSIEGALGGLATSVITAIICQLILLAIGRAMFSFGGVLTFGVLFGAAGQVGDLLESGFKRDAGIKDSGTIIAGHGGILDLMDSLIFCIPLMYLYLIYMPF